MQLRVNCGFYYWPFIVSDGDKKAYKESSQWAIRQNKDVISQLRQENKMLRAKLSKKMMVTGGSIL